MATFADLPSDIIMAIASLQRPAGESISRWKHTFYILSICRSWRATMLPAIYETVFISIPKDRLGSNPLRRRNKPSDYKAPYTNAGLIHENGYGFLVKRLFIFSQSRCDTPFTWLYVAESLNIDEDKYPEILALRKCIETYTDAEYQMALQSRAYINAFSSIASILAHRFPNASSLGIKTDDCNSSSTQTDALSEILSALASQLVKVDLQNFTASPAFLKATNIRYFNNKALRGFQDAPFINPESLVCLTLHSFSSKNIWNQFRCDNDSKSIEFTNLERLQLTGANSIGIKSQDTDDCHLKFPKLIHLTVHGSMITKSDFQHMASNLKTLDFTGGSDDAIRLFENNISGLEKMHLDLLAIIDEESDNRQLITQTNTLFSMLGPIPEVSCTDFELYNSYMSRIYWPNLTRLELTTNIEPYKFLCSIDRVPHLHHLHLKIISSIFEEEIEKVDEHTDNSDDDECYWRYMSAVLDWTSKELSRLSELRSEQPQSKLATLTIHWYTHGAYHRGYSGSNINDDKCNYEAHMQDAEADAALKVYFPNLESTEFSYIANYYYSDPMNLS